MGNKSLTVCEERISSFMRFSRAAKEQVRSSDLKSTPLDTKRPKAQPPNDGHLFVHRQIPSLTRNLRNKS